MYGIKTVGSICSGIEAASVAWKDLDLEFKWFSEIAQFPSKLLKEKYPNIPNLGNMLEIEEKLEKREIFAPDLICGGRPCQAFSYSGHRRGLEDERGNLALTFINIIETNDKIRKQEGKRNTFVFWENVEGVLSDKTNAFGCLISALAGLDDVIEKKKYDSFGYIHGKERNVAWRVLDAKYFGVPQQRKRVYLLAGDTNFYPEYVLFDIENLTQDTNIDTSLECVKDGVKYEFFRSYTDCLCASYSTKWNGDAASKNGSLYIIQDGTLRRFTPLECERIMGFPDGYTDINMSTNTGRYKALGNSWAVPVVRWIGNRLNEYLNGNIDCNIPIFALNTSMIPSDVVKSNLADIVEYNTDARLFISEKAKAGIYRRALERNIAINAKLKPILREAYEHEKGIV